MTRKQIMAEFHEEIEHTSDKQLHRLHDLAHERAFSVEAGREFIQAVDEVCEERGGEW